MKLFPLVLLALLPLGAIAANPDPKKSSPTISVSGRVIDHRKKPVKGVQVQAEGLRTVVTNSRGEFTIAGPAPRGDRLAVNFTAPGFMSNTRVYESTKRVGGFGTVVVVWPRVAGNGNTVVIWPRSAAVTLDATRGGRVPFANGGGVTLPERALVDSNGRPVTGKVSVTLTYLDVTNREQLRAAPGDFTARMRDGRIRLLESFGIFEISATDLQRRPVNLRRGQTARLELPAPPRRAAPLSTGLFSFDQRSGRWNEAGSLRRESRALPFTATINQLNVSWNADNVAETACMKVQVINPFTNPPNQPEANAFVSVTGSNYSGGSSAITDSNGVACLAVKRCGQVTVTAFSSQVSNWVSVPKSVTASCVVGNVGDCADPQKCPLVTVTLDLIVGGPQ